MDEESNPQHPTEEEPDETEEAPERRPPYETNPTVSFRAPRSLLDKLNETVLRTGLPKASVLSAGLEVVEQRTRAGGSTEAPQDRLQTVERALETIGQTLKALGDRALAPSEARSQQLKITKELGVLSERIRRLERGASALDKQIRAKADLGLFMNCETCGHERRFKVVYECAECDEQIR